MQLSPSPEIESTCDRCGAPTKPVVYGHAAHDLFLASERGKVVLGGYTLDRLAEAGYPCRHEPAVSS